MSMQTWKFDKFDTLPPGPWRDEPDKAQWVDEATDLDCLIVRNHMGAWCGYVGLPPGHPLHGKGYDEADPNYELDVHGGLTYAAPCQEDRAEGICHVPSPGRPGDVWWFGFDCAHSMDLTPSYDLNLHRTFLEGSQEHGIYRDVAYVRAECASLASQLAKVSP